MVSFFSKKAAEDTTAEVDVSGPDAPTDIEKPTSTHNGVREFDSDSDTISPDVQDGIKGIEATTSVWPKSHLILAYVL
jgi:hypothetical protein